MYVCMHATRILPAMETRATGVRNFYLEGSHNNARLILRASLCNHLTELLCISSGGHYLEGRLDLVSSIRTPRSNRTTPVVPIIIVLKCP